MVVVHGVRVAGPLEPYAEDLAVELARLGFTEMSARAQLGLAAHLSRWLAAAGLGTMALTAPVAEEYLAARGAAGYTAYLTPKALAPLLGYLRELGVVPGAEIAVPATQAEALLERYRRYLLAERGLREKVARGYVDSVRPFVASCAAARGADLRWLTAGDVTAFLTGKRGGWPRRPLSGSTWTCAAGWGSSWTAAPCCWTSSSPAWNSAGPARSP